jgi:hypothetical protein
MSQGWVVGEVAGEAPSNWEAVERKKRIVAIRASTDAFPPRPVLRERVGVRAFVFTRKLRNLPVKMKPSS